MFTWFVQQNLFSSTNQEKINFKICKLLDDHSKHRAIDNDVHSFHATHSSDNYTKRSNAHTDVTKHKQKNAIKSVDNTIEKKLELQSTVQTTAETIYSYEFLYRFLGVWKLDKCASTSMNEVSKALGVSWIIRRAIDQFIPTCEYLYETKTNLKIVTFLPLNNQRSVILSLTGVSVYDTDADIGSWVSTTEICKETLVTTRTRQSDDLEVKEYRSIKFDNQNFKNDTLCYVCEVRKKHDEPLIASSHRYFNRIQKPPEENPWLDINKNINNNTNNATNITTNNTITYSKPTLTQTKSNNLILFENFDDIFADSPSSKKKKHHRQPRHLSQQCNPYLMEPVNLTTMTSDRHSDNFPLRYKAQSHSTNEKINLLEHYYATNDVAETSMHSSPSFYQNLKDCETSRWCNTKQFQTQDLLPAQWFDQFRLWVDRVTCNNI